MSTAVLHLLVACMNVPTKVGAKAWEINFRNLANRADIFGINEAGNARAKALYRLLAGRLGYGYYGLFVGPNPVFWDRRKYRRYSATQVRLHSAGRGRLARLWPGFNGPRFLTVVVLRPITGGPLVTFINLHFVAPGPKVNEAWRAQMRAKSIARLHAIVDHHMDLGRVVVVVGDTNIKQPFPMPEGFLWLRSTGVDKLGVGVTSSRIHLDKAEAITSVVAFPGLTDHKHGISADIPLSSRKAAA